MDDIKEQILQFLYKQVQKNKIPNINKGMVEELEAFVMALIADAESRRSADRMKAQSEGRGLNSFEAEAEVEGSALDEQETA